MASTDTNKSNPPVDTLASPTPETVPATEKQSADVYDEFLKTGRVRAGFAVNVMWPEKARKVKKD